MHKQVFTRLEKTVVLLLLLSFFLPLSVGAWLRVSHNQSPATAWLRNATLGGVQAKIQEAVFTRSEVLAARWQAAWANNYDTSFAGRELLIRVIDELYLRVFHMAPVGVLVGPQLSLIEPAYLQEYYLIRDTGDALRPLVDDMRRLQDFCDARGTAFVALITPSKASIYPENNPGGWKLRQRPGPRYYDHFVPLLQEKGIHFVDGHRITADLKPTAGVPLFPTGGAHWTDTAVIATVNALLERFASAGLDVVPIRDYETRIDYKHDIFDADMANLINVVVPLRFPAPVIDIKPVARGVEHRPNSVLIGGSFLIKVFQKLDASREFSELDYYPYYVMGKQIRADGVQRDVAGSSPPVNFDNDVFAADSIVLEFNEERLAQPNHAVAFLHDALAVLPVAQKGATPTPAKEPFHYENPLAYHWDRTISLTSSIDAEDAARLTGFAPPSDVGAYTNAPVASIRFPAPPSPAEDMVLEATTVAFMVNAQFPRQTVEVYVNGHRVTNWDWATGSPPRREVALPKKFLTGGEVSVELRVEHPLSPAEMGIGPDPRKLGICVSKLRLHTAENMVASSPELRHDGLPAYRWNDVISFVAEKGTVILPEMKGWTAPGPLGVYTEGENVSLRFSAPPPKADVELTATTVGTVTGKGQPELTAKVFVNGHRVGEWTWKDAAQVERKLTIPKKFLGTGSVVVELHFDRVLSPAEMGFNGDPRKLGVCFTKMEFSVGKK